MELVWLDAGKTSRKEKAKAFCKVQEGVRFGG